MAGKDVCGGAAVSQNDTSKSTKDGDKFDDMRNKCHRCLDQSYRWFDCTARITPATKKFQNGSGEIIGCLAFDMLGKRYAVGECGQSEDGTGKWIADSGATFKMARSADLYRDWHRSEVNVRLVMTL